SLTNAQFEFHHMPSHLLKLRSSTNIPLYVPVSINEKKNEQNTYHMSL
ncbi:27716_t:CDS:1, partial [Racocetra persica]